MTEGVNIIRGDPRRAILKLSGPMIIAMLLTSIYNLVDAVWVAGLGGEALAAIGFVTPVYMVMVGLSNGLGAGAASSVSRYLGAGDMDAVDNSATHTVIITLAVSLVLTLIIELLLGNILLSLGAAGAFREALDYGSIVFAGTVFTLFTGAAYGILRSEGDAKRPMYAMGISAVLNMVLDPIFIYNAGWGIAGAAWATVISQLVVSLIIIYWFLAGKTFTSIGRGRFKPDRSIAWSIISVTVPASAEFFIMSMVTAVINWILVTAAGTSAVAVYSAGWRIVMMAIVPVIAVATALISVSGFAYGSKNFRNLEVAHGYSIKIGLIIAAATAGFTFILAPWISWIFSYSQASAALAPRITEFLRVICLFYIFLPPGIMSGSVFQGTGRGLTSLVLSFIRQVLLVVVFAYLLAVTLGMGEAGVWWGVVAGDIGGSLIAYTWARVFIGRLKRYGML
ncbi:MATE family efflux transporter [Methanothermobacter wolfeii]|uniref:MATE family efflux transporter n=1 Tax=Methanothermobacter wolfeii TaxID=145261 RepID=A0A9E7RUA8_METWO|nr:MULTISPECIES: MATE family efflux transporter [Methanothermobacter]QHN06210.1 MATE family efflux transporter [Methanothermobacter sp. THM-1]UXH32410.1 MATE family efflux transporter [Methanothermobacter wolfeii]SCM56813.1 putative transporter MJ0709 [Methanothermobacter wolfeii]